MTRYIACHSSSVPLGKDYVLVGDAAGMVRAIPVALARLLEHCQSSRTLEKHAEAAINARLISPEQLAPVAEGLNFLVSNGLLVSEEDLLRVSAPAGQTPDRGPLTLGVVTRDRPNSTKRLVSGLFEACAKNNRTIELVVCDDSTESGAEATRSLLKSYKRRFGIPVRYAGAEEKQQFINRASKTIPRHILRFALFGSEGSLLRPGANRNALQLDTVGLPVVSLDDDVLWKWFRAPRWQSAVHLTSLFDPAEHGLYRDMSGAMEAVGALEEDPLAFHQDLLGGSISECLNGKQVIEAVAVGPQFRKTLRSGRGRIVATFSGLVGDSGCSSPMGILRAEGVSRERLVASPEDYEALCKTRYMVRACDGLTLTDSPWCMLYCAGLDNRSILPPYFPIGWSEDSLFGVLVRICDSNALFAHLPLCVAHCPDRTREFARDQLWRDAARFFIADLLMMLCSNAFNPVVSELGAPDNLLATGNHLASLSRLRHDSLEELIRHCFWRHASHTIGACETLLARYSNAPSYWARDVERQAGYLRERAVDIGAQNPLSFADAQCGIHTVEAFANALKLFGELLAAWPEARSVASEMSGNGEGIAVSL